MPLDRRRKWYRYHHLLRELLTAELRRREPEVVPRLHARAAAWCEANGLPEVAIDHAQAAGDADRVAGLVEDLVQPAYASGRAETARRWARVVRGPGRDRTVPVDRLPGGRGPCAAGPAGDGGAPGGGRTRPGRGGTAARAFARLLEGISYVVDGDADRADPILTDAVDAFTQLGGMPGAAAATASRAVVAIGRQDWDEAETLARRALEIVRDGHLDDYIMSPLVHAVVARTALHRGDLARAQEHLARAARLRPLLTYAVPHFAVLTLHDPAGARTVLRQARDILRLRPDLGILPRQAEERRERLDAVQGGTVGPSSLPTAELRLLPLLSTHLSFKEIGGRLHVSRHTVKSQAISVYRRLGVSSRGEAIARVRELGLLGS